MIQMTTALKLLICDDDGIFQLAVKYSAQGQMGVQDGL